MNAPGFVAEELALGQRLGQAAAIERHEVLAAALAVVVQAARDQLLAGAGLAVDEHVGRGLRQRQHRAAHLLHLRRAADQHGLDAVPVVERVAQRRAPASASCRRSTACRAMATRRSDVNGFSMKS